MRRLKGFVLVVHPVPILGVCAVATILGLSLSNTRHDVERLAPVVAAIFFSQLIVGISNDLVDYPLDKNSQPWKPLVAGWITQQDATAFLVVAMVALFLCLLGLDIFVGLIVLVGTFAGLLHNFAFKGTHYDWCSYVLGFVSLPLAIWVGLNRFHMEQALIFFPAAFILVAVLIARDLPDVDADSREGKRGLAVRLGITRSVYLICVALVMAGLAALAFLLIGKIQTEILLAGLAIYFLISFVNIFRYLKNGSVKTFRENFRIAVLGAVLLIGSCLFALRT